MEFQLSFLGFREVLQDHGRALVASVKDKTPRKYVQATQKGHVCPICSTPVHPKLDDSGYYSMQRDRAYSTSGKRKFSFIDVEESSGLASALESLQKQHCEDRLNSGISQIGSISKFQDDYLSNLEVVERLRFKPSPDPVSFLCPNQRNSVHNPSRSNQPSFDAKNSLFKRVEYGTEEPDKDVDFYFGFFPQPIDCITKLHRHHCYAVLSNVLSFLSEKDLTSASVVCRAWKDAVSDHQSSLRRKSTYLLEREMDKENSYTHYFVPPKKEINRARILGDVSNLLCLNEKKNSKTKHNPKNPIPLLQITSARYEPGLVQKCPVCSFACEIKTAKLKMMCGNKTCRYEFCAKCFGPYNQKHICTLLASGKNIQKTVLCSKKCMKNLQRL